MFPSTQKPWVITLQLSFQQIKSQSIDGNSDMFGGRHYSASQKEIHLSGQMTQIMKKLGAETDNLNSISGTHKL